MLTGKRSLVVGALIAVIAAVSIISYLVWQSTALPAPGTPQYLEYVHAFQVGVAALDSGVRPELALPRLNRAIEVVPNEPAGWANRGLYYLRNNNLAEADRDLNRAHQLARDSSEIESLLGLLAKRKGRLPDAVTHLRNALEKDPRDLPALFALAKAIQEAGGPDSETQYQQLIERILAIQPNNLYALMQRAVTAYHRKDDAALRDTLDHLQRLEPTWTKTESGEWLAKARKAIDGGAKDASIVLIQFGNMLMAERGYRRDSAALRADDASSGTSLQHFLRLRSPRPTPAPMDDGLKFTVAPWAGGKLTPADDKTRWDLLTLTWRIRAKEQPSVTKAAIDGGLFGPPARVFEPLVFVANGHELRRADVNAPLFPFPGGPNAIAPSLAGVLPLDWNNDLRIDLLLAGAGGLRFLEQQADGSLVDVTKKTGLPANLLDAEYYGAWAADLEMDGDLDVILARRNGPPVVLRNNGDGTFTPIEVKQFAGLRDVRWFVWADLDNDGANDAVFLDAKGKLHVFANERSLQFKPWPLPDDIGAVAAVTAADVNDDGVFDLVALTGDKLVRISDVNHRASWQRVDLANVQRDDGAPADMLLLFVEDLDNNGALDIVVSSRGATQVFLADEKFGYHALPERIPLQTFALLDLNSDGRLDFLGMPGSGREILEGRNQGSRAYHWQEFRPLANPKAEGDNRNNSFAVGGEIEVRAGLLVQKQRITGPLVHFGLGDQDKVDVARVVWPSGNPQFEFEPPAGEPLLALAQRLTGSCPFLFTHDGDGMRFAGDCLWNTPLGMFVNGQNVDSFGQTTEWLKVPGTHLVPKNGVYDLRVHANLWETDYFDQVALLVVDHPSDTEVHVDERFFLTPTPPKLYVTTPARPVARAWDHLGNDATDVVAAIDGRYLDRAGRGKYQGITADHWVEADLGDEAPTDGPVYLIARGWTHPTDSSINVAIAQGRHEAPRPLVLEVPDGKGGWKIGRPALGFPAGKNKTMVLRLDGIDGPGVSRRFRLRTNMEIYWDYLGYARGLDETLARVERPVPKSAELRYRGFLEMTQMDTSSPEVPHYDRVMRGRQVWRDLEGYYTRYGDMRELLAKADDRYVIMNAGDEIALEYPVPAGPQAGWRRDFIFECDGWTRDGNPNTRFGTTVLPLPMHGLKSLDRPPGRLDDDPVVRRFPDDWLRYHTRYVSTDDFERGLRPLPRR